MVRSFRRVNMYIWFTLLLIHSSIAVGPFLMSCLSLFLMVNTDNGYAIEGTDKIQNASEFYIFPAEDGSHPYEFKIAYLNSVKALKNRRSTLHSFDERKQSEVPSFLNVPTDVIGRSPGPLRMKYAVTAVHSRFALKSRILKSTAESVSTTPWVTGKDVFYIQCARRSYKRNSFLALRQQTRRQGSINYRLTAVPSVNYHNETNTFMLFKLISPVVHRKIPSAGGHRDVHPAETTMNPGFEELDV